MSRTLHSGQRIVIVAGAAIAILGAGIVVGRCSKQQVSQAPAVPSEPAVITVDGGVEPATITRGASAPVLHEGLVDVQIRDGDGDKIPARLTFLGTAGTPTPRFTTVDIGREEQGAISAFDRAFVARGDAILRVPPGHYHVWVGHGPEWDDAMVGITVAAGAQTPLHVTLHHVVDTPGWISADFHVHAAASYDSKVPMSNRVMQFLADGVDLIVSADHNVVADYAPVIADLGVGDLLASLPGDEVTTKDWGHFGAFPLVSDPEEAGRGAPPVAGRTPAEIFAQIRKEHPGTLIDVHHPRLENGAIGYFHLAELDPSTLEAKRIGYSADFDAIEILNGFQDQDRRSVDPVLRDWFAFLRTGRRVTGLGNSDTHYLTQNLGGYPRNYIRMDPKEANDPVAVAAAVKAGHVFFTTGPIIDFTIGSAGPGDDAIAHDGAVAVHLRVRAPAWMDVGRVELFVDGVSTMRWEVHGDRVVRFDRTIALRVKPGDFVLARAEGNRPMPPIIGDVGGFRVYPYAVTNPIWITSR